MSARSMILQSNRVFLTTVRECKGKAAEIPDKENVAELFDFPWVTTLDLRSKTETHSLKGGLVSTL